VGRGALLPSARWSTAPPRMMLEKRETPKRMASRFVVVHAGASWAAVEQRWWTASAAVLRKQGLSKRSLSEVLDGI
jgi:hypothetical protein